MISFFFAMFCTFPGYAKTATRLILWMWGCFTVTPGGILVWMTHRKSSECSNTTTCERIKNGHARQVQTIMLSFNIFWSTILLNFRFTSLAFSHILKITALVRMAGKKMTVFVLLGPGWYTYDNSITLVTSAVNFDRKNTAFFPNQFFPQISYWSQHAQLSPRVPLLPHTSSAHFTSCSLNLVQVEEVRLFLPSSISKWYLFRPFVIMFTLMPYS